MRRFILLLVCLAMLLSAQLATARAEEDTLTILFTHDMHSKLLPYAKQQSGQEALVGGFARLKAALDRAAEGENALIVDAGDFSMGTLYQTIYATHAAELRLLGALGFEAVTLGNHEFDFGTQGLADMLHSAAASGDPLPQLLFHAGSLPYEATDARTPLEDLSDAFAAVGARQTMILEKNGVRVGLFSAFGEASVDFTPTLELTLPGIIDNAKQAVAQLKADGAELIVCLSHSGTNKDPKKSEDELLAAAVPEIDVIVSGHTHTRLEQPIAVGKTLIVSCGAYVESLGRLVIRRDGGRWARVSYELIPIDERLPEDEAIAGQVGMYKREVESSYLSRFGSLTFDEIIGYAGFAEPPGIAGSHSESMLANLIADAYAAAARDEDRPVALAVAARGTIRGQLPKGEITLSDAFVISSLGVGSDGLSGYPLVDAYLTGKELYALAEVDASVAPIMPQAQLYTSGMHYRFNPNRLIFNKVTDAYLVDEAGNRVEIERDKLYRVICGLYSAQMLGSVKAKSFGILSIEPKDEAGNIITDFDSRILRYENGEEIKEWYALTEYIRSFDKNEDGLAQVPDSYGALQGRKVIENDKSLLIFFTHLNGFAWMVYGIILAVLLILALAVWLIARAVRRRRKKRGQQSAAK